MSPNACARSNVHLRFDSDLFWMRLVLIYGWFRVGCRLIQGLLEIFLGTFQVYLAFDVFLV